ncbi:hypothetical protein [uncultured Duncaniella sp.]|jgi:hypothetical protein|nr:hypothetical protein [uncultured Duncaniella sp.]
MLEAKNFRLLKFADVSLVGVGMGCVGTDCYGSLDIINWGRALALPQFII